MTRLKNYLNLIQRGHSICVSSNMYIKILHKPLFFTLRVCDCKKPDCKELELCTIPYGGQDDSCGVNGSCAPLKFCEKVFGLGFGIGAFTGLIAGIGIGSELEKAKGMGMVGRSRNQDIKPKPNGCCFCNL